MATKNTGTTQDAPRATDIRWGGTHAERGRALADVLTQLASELEAGSHPDGEVRRLRVEGAIDAMYAVAMGLEGSNAQRQALLREDLIDRCKGWRDHTRAGPSDARTVDAYESYAELAIQGHAAIAPQNEALARRHKHLIAAVIRADVENRGGRGNRAANSMNDAVEALCDAMGWAADAETIKRTRRRRKPPGQ